MSISRIKQKFQQKFPELNFTVHLEGEFKGEYSDPETLKIFNIFKTGWTSHPSYSDTRVYVIGKITETGVTIAEKPRLHINGNAAHNERNRLQNKHKEKFVLFSCIGDDGKELKDIVLKNYRKEKGN